MTIGKTIRSLDKGFTMEVDGINKKDWSQIIQCFDDANIYQSWEFGLHNWGKKNNNHFILKKDDRIVAVALVRVFVFPLISIGFALVSWGPLWKIKSEKRDYIIFRNAIRALKNHYSVSRRLLLRIRCNEIHSDNGTIEKIFHDEGFFLNKHHNSYTTITIDLTQDLDDIRSGFRKNWRKNLRIAEKQNLTVEQSSDFKYLQLIVGWHKEMVKRKKFTRYVADTNLYTSMQNDFADDLKMRNFVCKYQNKLVGGIAVSTFGDTGMPILGSSTAESIEMKLNVTYLLHWKIICWLKNNNFKYYDLKGYCPKEYPGPSLFKAGMRGNIVDFVAIHETYENIFSLVATRIGEIADVFFNKYIPILKKYLLSIFIIPGLKISQKKNITPHPLLFACFLLLA